MPSITFDLLISLGEPYERFSMRNDNEIKRTLKIEVNKREKKHEQTEMIIIIDTRDSVCSTFQLRTMLDNKMSLIASLTKPNEFD